MVEAVYFKLIETFTVKLHVVLNFKNQFQTPYLDIFLSYVIFDRGF